METFDYIFAGGGAAGLGLAYQMLGSTLADKSILIVDREAKNQNDRTWSFWTDQPCVFDEIAYRVWDKIRFESETFAATLALAPFRYQMIRGIDFYAHTRAALEGAPNVRFVRAPVEDIRDGVDCAEVRAGGQTFRGGWVFDSIVRPQDIQRNPQRYHYLLQHFKGWEIETEEDVFDPDTPTFFDFRTPQNGAMRFVYILPFSPRRALVEYTLFSAQTLPDGEYDAALHAYIRDVLHVEHYQVHTVEQGIIPMTDHPFPRCLGSRVMAIGTKGGRVKPSSGYAFLRMARDGAAIVRSLVEHGEPFHIPPDRRRYQFYDRVMLQLMYRSGGKMAWIFTEMFRRNPVQRIFHFLNEDQPFFDDTRLMVNVPMLPFTLAMLKVYLLGKI